jgi:hypothetical protein
MPDPTLPQKVQVSMIPGNHLRTGSRIPWADNLRDIHRADLFSVPFETLDIDWGRPIRIYNVNRMDGSLRRGPNSQQVRGNPFRIQQTLVRSSSTQRSTALWSAIEIRA